MPALAGNERCRRLSIRAVISVMRKAIPAGQGFGQQVVDVFALTPALAIPDTADLADSGDAFIGPHFDHSVFGARDCVPGCW